jgi:hypothetical protein
MRRTIVAVLSLVVALPMLAEQRERSIGAMYDGLGALSCGERSQAYSSYPREQQLELWTLHLQKFLVNHPNLTGAQRSLVFEGLEMVASGALDRTDDPKAMSLVQAFKQRAQVQFDQETFKDAFVRLGGRVDSAAGVRRPERVGALQPYCDCSRDEDCGGSDCNFLRPCTEVPGCGPFRMELCVGACE